MEETSFIIGITLLAYLLEYLKYEFNLTLINLLLFINIFAIYYLFNRIKISIKITLN